MTARGTHADAPERGMPCKSVTSIGVVVARAGGAGTPPGVADRSDERFAVSAGAYRLLKRSA